MHFFGYNASSHELYLPLMFGTVKDVLVRPEKAKPNAKWLKNNEGELRAKAVRTALVALLRGLVELHNLGVAHRDIKHENLLVQIDPRDPRFGVLSVKISDLGYSLDIRKVAENQLINAQARDELPGTPPFTSPELLQARIDRKNVVQTAIKYALSIETQADKITSLKTLARRNASKDKDQKIGDWAAKAELEKLIGSDTFKSAEFQAAVSAADAKYQQSLAIVQAAPEKLDVFSAALTAWMCFNPDVAEPDPELPTHKIVSDKERLNRLVKDGRPSLKVQKDTIDQELFKKLVGAKFFQDAWHTDPAARSSVPELLNRLDAAMA